MHFFKLVTASLMCLVGTSIAACHDNCNRGNVGAGCSVTCDGGGTGYGVCADNGGSFYCATG
ncbi:uncharacterized protein EKO05_0007597 [Ascochyta rabiei]|uniref:uncharacterized protein n=1 Tax=Didymella rabiei TaxID=5454 RepID=UPI0021FCE53F|nr:uncharacterized protein EKO05_0007597 [Ascochyta rabiei]UPX17231.1 hypothetical protein EKO05_0007597 [Ascochyta rabiei]